MDVDTTVSFIYTKCRRVISVSRHVNSILSIIRAIHLIWYWDACTFRWYFK